MDREQRIDGLVKKILSGESSLIYELWRELDDLCGWYCRKLLRQLPDAFKLEFEDLYNCGFIALCDALQHCTLENHAGFSTYYLFYLTGTIMQENRLTKGGYYKDGRRRFDPIITGGTLSLDAPTDESQDNPETLYNLLSDEQAPYSPADMADRIIDRIYNQQLHDILEELIAVLPEQQQFVIRQKYYEGANCLEIAEYMGVKRSRVSQDGLKFVLLHGQRQRQYSGMHTRKGVTMDGTHFRISVKDEDTKTMGQLGVLCDLIPSPLEPR